MKSNIGKLIDERGYKKKFIAEKMEVTPAQLSNWINNRNYIPMDKAFKLAKILGCKVDDLYSFEGGDSMVQCADCGKKVEYLVDDGVCQNCFDERED